MAAFCRPLVGSRNNLPHTVRLWQETTGDDDSPRRQPRFLATARRQPHFSASCSSAAVFFCQ
jgi:hypothetical protein